jgi:hypothetical protein
MTKVFKILLCGLALSSCCDCDDRQYNPSGYDSGSMTETELYSTYGLEPPKEFYQELIDSMESSGFGVETYCEQAEKENPKSTVFRVYARVDSGRITRAEISASDFSNKVNNEIERLLETLDWKYELKASRSGDYDFRLDLEKICEMKK